jgi:hypothetical protein
MYEQALQHDFASRDGFAGSALQKIRRLKSIVGSLSGLGRGTNRKSASLLGHLPLNETLKKFSWESCYSVALFRDTDVGKFVEAFERQNQEVE